MNESQPFCMGNTYVNLRLLGVWKVYFHDNNDLSAQGIQITNSNSKDIVFPNANLYIYKYVGI
jgi:hypothetical protein